VITKDLLVEDVHFRTRYSSPESLAQKALHVNLSDLAAMGATPLFFLLGISVPNTYFESIETFLNAFVDECKKTDVVLIGGDTTKSTDKFFISITAIGTSDSQTIKKRSGANQSDILCVSGNLGYSHLGLIALENDQDGHDLFKEIFLKPVARVKEGKWLSRQDSVTSMMDVSDGLITDLKKLCTASQVGASLNLDHLEFSTDYLASCSVLNLDPYQTALVGGEDYGLLFTVAADAFAALESDFLKTFGYRLKKLGTISSQKIINVFKNNKPITIIEKPFTHFGESL
jgi:thiamine-monophosphate kinase